MDEKYVKEAVFMKGVTLEVGNFSVMSEVVVMDRSEAGLTVTTKTGDASRETLMLCKGCTGKDRCWGVAGVPDKTGTSSVTGSLYSTVVPQSKIVLFRKSTK